jgi:CDP-diacylglycerol--glycerol-3-phosphate 3-phosphatidyltransferase
MTGVVAVQIGTERRYDGPMGKSDRAFVFGAVCLLVGLGMNASLWVNYVLAATLVLSGLTIFNRACRALEAVA